MNYKFSKENPDEKLLIVEDEEYIADFMMIGLEKAGYE